MPGRGADGARRDGVTHQNSSAIRLVISDFGGVICTYDYNIFCRRLARRAGRAPEEIHAAAFDPRLQQEFESGAVSGREFHQVVMARLHLDIPYDEFAPMYGDIFTPIAATCSLLRALHASYPLYLLSDTNEIHFGYVRETQPVLRLFAERILSYEVRARKPDPAMYREALRRSGLPAEACVFVDDRSANVEGARRAGMPAVQFESTEQMAMDLRRLGVRVP
jgi:HAD superfamily hydrolase (TIGR01509 family)